ncbi:hypothetical protein [Rhizobium laguerreae]|uniref:hypothetical protein n=1 Tax=Rhizobium laguerreae TaxID=1076926 RepID=UPI001C90C74F|nr:hypothetical protein [Rhizobium laguerreae]MBY3557345.1 hypothetical protein [Rhizobium laguerreae]
MSRKPDLEVLVAICNTDDFHGWSQQKKVERYERVLEWHDFVRANKDVIPYVWGTHQVLSQNLFSTIRSMHLLVYRVKDLFELDDLMDRDPLRDVSQYLTWLLSPLEDDLVSDLKRLEKLRAEFGSETSFAENESWKWTRSLYSQKPEFVGKYKPIAPPNPHKDYSDRHDGKMEILVVGTNSNDSMNWSDAKQLITYEKISWWADYAWMLIHGGQVTHGWNLHDFCDAKRPAERTCGATLIYSVHDWEEFDGLYSLDPVRRKGSFWSVVLQPIARQEELDKRRLRDAYSRLREDSHLAHRARERLADLEPAPGE